MAVVAGGCRNGPISFGAQARKVRDCSLFYGQRFKALAKCVELYQPFGYNATFTYLREQAGPYRDDEAAMVRAVDTLEASRRLWRAELEAYRKRRTVAKRQGDRTPKAGDREPDRLIWYGDEGRAALSAIRFTLRHRGDGAAADPAVVRMAERCLESGGALTSAQRERVAELRERNKPLQNQTDVEWPERNRAVQSLWLLHLITAAGPARTSV